MELIPTRNPEVFHLVENHSCVECSSASAPKALGAKLLLGYVQVTDNFEGEIMAPVPVSDAR
jgi:hypothetical protein